MPPGVLTTSLTSYFTIMTSFAYEVLQRNEKIVENRMVGSPARNSRPQMFFKVGVRKKID